MIKELEQYPSTLSSIKNLAILGVDDGQIVYEFSQLYKPSGDAYTYSIHSVDNKTDMLPKNRKVRQTFHGIDFYNNLKLPIKMDMVYTEKLSYAYNPYGLVKNINHCLTDGGILCMRVPCTSSIKHNRFQHYTESHQPFCWTPTSLIYLLASNGFECTHFRKEKYEDFIDVFVYKVLEPLDNPSWYDLVEKALLTQPMANMINKRTYLNDLELPLTWIDGHNSFNKG